MLFAGLARASDPDDARWAAGFNFGTSGPWEVDAMTIYGTDLVMGGHFLGSVPGLNIVLFDGYTWKPLGAGLGPEDAAVKAVIVHNGFLYAGGTFTSGVRYLARWENMTWRSRQLGLTSWVSALGTYAGKLYVGTPSGVYGPGPTPNWVKLPQVIGWVYDFEVYRDELIVAGWNLTPGKHILRWNGSAWDSLGSGTNASVSALALYRGDLIAGGSFDRAGTADAHKVARWDGTSWNALDASEFVAGYDGVNSVEDLIVQGEDLIVGGWFSAVGSIPTPRVARWDGTSWHSAGSGAPGGWVTTFAPFRGELIVGAHWGARAWDGSTWQAVDAGLGLDGPVLDFVEHEGKLVAAGYFTHASDWVPARCIAAWGNGSWSPIGPGFDTTVWAVDHYNDALVATGSFTQSGPDIVQHIALWDGTTWRPLGSGLNGTGHALAVFEGSLVAGGEFTTAGGVAANRVARWDGTSWSALGNGLDNNVRALVVHEGSLFAGGDFNFGSKGSPELAHVARWDGIEWQPLGAGLDGNVHDLLSVKSTLVALGEFETAGSTVARGAAAWDGSTWKDLGGGFDGTAMGGLEHLGRIYVTGSFHTAGGNPASGIASWDGASWSKLGSGLEQGGSGRTLAVFGSGLFVGGNFLRAGDKASHNIARWGLPDPVDTPEAGTASRGTDLLLPFRPDDGRPIVIRFRTGASYARVSLTIFDVKGKLVRGIDSGALPPGDHDSTWDRRDTTGARAARGVYIVRLETGTHTVSRKLALLR